MTISLFFEIMYLVVVLSVIVVILLENRDPHKTVVWILLLLFLPVLGLVLYFVFGENYRRTKSVMKRLNNDLPSGDTPIFTVSDSGEVLKEYNRQVTLFKNADSSPILGGNKIDFYTSGASKYESMFADIEKATDHIHLLYYILIDDEIGQQLKEILIRKAQQGVEVRVIYDDFGSIETKKKFFREMREGGVEVEVFLPIRFPRVATRMNYRNHRKIAVIDGKVGYIGGMNISKQYVVGYSWGIWHDMQIRIEGQGVYGLQQVFILDWYYTHKVKLENSRYYPQMPSDGKAPMQIVSSGPNDPYGSIESGYFEAITNAKEYIYLTTPYFIPSDHVLKAIQLAAVSGVDVRIILPFKSDSMLVDAVTFSYVRTLLESGVKVYFYQRGFIHSKTMVADDYLFTVGSSNMDMRSFEILFETNSFIYERETALRAKQFFLSDLNDSKLIDLDSWNKRAWTRKIAESVMRLLAPLF